MTTAEPQQPAGGVSSAEVLGLPREDRSRPEGPRVCAECGAAAKYTCPGCQTQTCSLPCSKGHKARTGCTGKRNRATYVSLDEYSERHLASDFGLLEEAQRAHEAAGRGRPARPKPFAELPSHIKTLIGQARSRGVTLEMQQPGMARRMRNSTRWEGGAKRHIVWRVEWQFPGAAGASFEDRRVPDPKPLRPYLEAHLTPAAGGGLAASHVLRRYAQAGADNLVVLMRRPHMPANAPEFWRIDIDQPLRSQLQGRAVIEFPTLLVLTQEEFAAGNYPLARAPVPPPAPPPGPPPAGTTAASGAAAAAPGGVAGSAANAGDLQPTDVPPADRLHSLVPAQPPGTAAAASGTATASGAAAGSPTAISVPLADRPSADKPTTDESAAPLPGQPPAATAIAAAAAAADGNPSAAAAGVDSAAADGASQAVPQQAPPPGLPASSSASAGAAVLDTS